MGTIMQFFRKYIKTGASLLVGAVIVSHLLNFVFNAYLGRILSFEAFGLITLINTLLYILSVFTVALSNTLTHKTAYVTAKLNKQAGVSFFRKTQQKSLLIGGIVSIVWMLFTPLTALFFNTGSILPLLLFTPAVSLAILTAVNTGYLKGTFSFAALAFITVIEPLAKLLLTFTLVTFGLTAWVYTAIPFALIGACLLSYLLTSKTAKTPKNIPAPYQFPKRFFSAALVTILATTLFFNLDVLLAMHYLSSKDAGIYALLSLVGKMIFFFGSLLSYFIIPFTSRDEGLKKNPNILFYKLFAGSLFLTLFIYFVIGPLGGITLPILFGPKILTILSYLPQYGLAIALFCISNVFITYHLARKQYILPIISLIIAGLMGIGIMLFHASIAQIVQVVFLASVARMGITILFHFVYSYLKYNKESIVESNKLAKQALLNTKKPTVLIGIPAYNEEANITSLLRSLLEQKEDTYVLEKIVVMNDDSNDKTVKKVRAFKSNKIEVRTNKTRQGQIYSQNSIFVNADTDIVILLEADTKPSSNTYIKELIKPLLQNTSVGLVHGNIQPLKPETFIEKISSTQFGIYCHHTLHRKEQLNLLCSGRGGRAFAKFVYEKLRWPKAVPEDDYAYLWCKERNIQTAFQKTAVCHFRSPQTLTDYFREKQKNKSASITIQHHFEKDMLNEHKKKPIILMLQMKLHFMLTHPILFFCYSILKIVVSLKSVNKEFTDFWPVTSSTKLVTKTTN